MTPKVDGLKDQGTPSLLRVKNFKMVEHLTAPLERVGHRKSGNSPETASVSLAVGPCKL